MVQYDIMKAYGTSISMICIFGNFWIFVSSSIDKSALFLK